MYHFAHHAFSRGSDGHCNYTCGNTFEHDTQSNIPGKNVYQILRIWLVVERPILQTRIHLLNMHVYTYIYNIVIYNIQHVYVFTTKTNLNKTKQTLQQIKVNIEHPPWTKNHLPNSPARSLQGGATSSCEMFVGLHVYHKFELCYNVAPSYVCWFINPMNTICYMYHKP